MLRRFFKREPSVYNEPIFKVLKSMETTAPDHDEFPDLITYLERLTALKAEERRRWKVSPDTMVVVLGNLLGILIIVAYEQKHVVTSKGLGFVLKAKQPLISS